MAAAAAAVTDRRPRTAPASWAGAAAVLSLASAPLHMWLLLLHRHAVTLSAILLLMTLACAWCAAHVLRGATGGRSGLVGLLIMADAMALAHAGMLLAAGAAGHAHHGGHAPGALPAPSPADPGASLLLMVALELAVALCAALALRSLRQSG